MKTTKYDDVNKVLDLLTTGLQETLGGNLVALYLTGSLTYGDFKYESSDIDFLAVLTRRLTQKQLEAVKAMHIRIAHEVPYWAKRLEGSYIPARWLGSISRPAGKRPYVNTGVVSMLPYGNEWVLNLYVLRDSGIALVGPESRSLIQPIDIKDVREASKRDLLEEWEPKTREIEPFRHPDYENSHLQAYAILTICRILHRAKVDAIVSKRVASTWAKKTYGQWSSLIEEAENWRHGIRMDKQQEVKEFIRFAIKEIRSSENYCS